MIPVPVHSCIHRCGVRAIHSCIFYCTPFKIKLLSVTGLNQMSAVWRGKKGIYIKDVEHQSMDIRTFEAQAEDFLFFFPLLLVL